MTIYRFFLQVSVVLATLILLVPGAGPAKASDPGVTITIPTIEIDAPVVDVHVRRISARETTWDVSALRQEVGYFVGTANIGEGGNTVLGAHSELARRTPSVFYRLEELQPGDEIYLQRDGTTYIYVVTEVYTVPREDLRPIMPTLDERLTLITCDIHSFQGGFDYADRTIVIATRIG
ncbi:MAG: sortase [Chloroflexota bacterium]